MKERLNYTQRKDLVVVDAGSNAAYTFCHPSLRVCCVPSSVVCEKKMHHHHHHRRDDKREQRRHKRYRIAFVDTVRFVDQSLGRRRNFDVCVVTKPKRIKKNRRIRTGETSHHEGIGHEKRMKLRSETKSGSSESGCHAIDERDRSQWRAKFACMTQWSLLISGCLPHKKSLSVLLVSCFRLSFSRSFILLLFALITFSEVLS